MRTDNPFIHAPTHYKRDIDPLQQSLEQAALYLSRTRNRSYDDCLAFVKKNVQADGIAPMSDPTVFFLARQTNGDRAKRSSTFSEYLKFSTDHQLVMVPTMTVYFNPHQRKSFLAEYIELNVAKRDVHKKAMFDAKAMGDIARMNFEDNNQSVAKYKNNSLSGGQLSPYTPLYNKSGHSTLTSTCRATTSYANANNEWFLMGNRHYWHPNVVLNHLTTTLKYTDLVAVQEVIDLYGLHIPSVEQVMNCIKWSSRFYWHSERHYGEIQRYVETFSPVERAAFVYVGDLHHLAIHNEAFVRELFTLLSVRAVSPSLTPKEDFAEADEDIIVMATLLCSEQVGSRKLKTVKDEDPEVWATVAATCKHIKQSVEHYRPLIEALWRPAVLPPSIAHIPGIKRRAVIASDTDSTIFTTQRWTTWYNDGEYFTPKCYDIGYTTVYLTSQMVLHKLAQMSANLGFVPEHLFKIEMKNEYYFPIFTLTNMAKHYFAYRSAQEGLILKSLEAEIKGVNLRDSTVAPQIMKQAKGFMEMIMRSAMQKGQLSLQELLTPVANLEKEVFDSLAKGGFDYLKAIQVKDLDSYIQKDEAPNIQHHKFWNEVFSPKYGEAPEPPYNAVRISVDLGSKKALELWLNSIKDVELAVRLRDWIRNNAKTGLTTLVLPSMNLELYGIPEEIVPVIFERKIVATAMNAFYIVLESMGIFMKNRHFSKLVTDFYKTPDVIDNVNEHIHMTA